MTQVFPMVTKRSTRLSRTAPALRPCSPQDFWSCWSSRVAPRLPGQSAVPYSKPGQEELTFWVNHNGLEQLDVLGEVGFGDMARILMRRRSNAPRCAICATASRSRCRTCAPSTRPMCFAWS